MMRTTSVRLPEEYVEEIEEACKLEGVDKGAMLRKLIDVYEDARKTIERL